MRAGRQAERRPRKGTMEIVRQPMALLGAFFVADGILLYVFERGASPGVALGFGSLYAAAGVALIAGSLKRSPPP